MTKTLPIDIASETLDKTENLWVFTTDTQVLLSIDTEKGTLVSFSCRLGPGVVVEMGMSRNLTSGDQYPCLCIFAEEEGHATGPLQFVRKCNGQWIVENSDENA